MERIGRRRSSRRAWACGWGRAACVDTTRRASTTDAAGGVQPVTCQGTPPVAVRGRRGHPVRRPGAHRPVRLEERRHQGWRLRQRHRDEPGAAGARLRAHRRGRRLPVRSGQRSAGRRSPTGSGSTNSNLIGIESIAADPVDPNRVYLAAGEYTQRRQRDILSSTDMGRPGPRTASRAPMGGNADGRSMGERLAVDPNLPSTLYFGSRNGGALDQRRLGADLDAGRRASRRARRRQRRGRRGNSVGERATG